MAGDALKPLFPGEQQAGSGRRWWETPSSLGKGRLALQGADRRCPIPRGRADWLCRGLAGGAPSPGKGRLAL